MVEYLEKKDALLTLLEKNNLFLTKNRGQNFLVDLNIRKKLVSFLPETTSSIIEIGAGLGHFSYLLQDKTPNLISVEIDKGFIPSLQEAFPNIQIIHQDFLKLSLEDIAPHLILPYIICGNIPYLLSTKICEHILSFPILPEQIFITVEKDYATEKLLNPLTSLHKKLARFYEIKYLQNIPRSCFFPAPKKDSTFIGFFKAENRVKNSQDMIYLEFIDRLFKSPKKTLWNNLIDYQLPTDFWENKENLKKLRVHQLTNLQIHRLFNDILKAGKNVCQK